MKIPLPIVCICLSAWIGLAGWQSKMLIDLKADVAALGAKFEIHISQPAKVAANPPKI